MPSKKLSLAALIAINRRLEALREGAEQTADDAVLLKVARAIATNHRRREQRLLAAGIHPDAPSEVWMVQRAR